MIATGRNIITKMAETQTYPDRKIREAATAAVEKTAAETCSPGVHASIKLLHFTNHPVKDKYL